tara:strand:- start:525 stop:650 length:126 start_codon:yes stop_codon:yes gene_type:complete
MLNISGDGRTREKPKSQIKTEETTKSKVRYAKPDKKKKIKK